ncbi:MAG: cold-shock protein [Candidatus Peribacteria bacterium]|nr:cold-shock protein [Candidatus Peribacteria bacterium]
MANGVIKKKMQDKGFGFISMEGASDIFFHISATDGQFDSLREGQAVTFDIEDSPKGSRAINVQVA